MQIVFCERCGIRVNPGDLESGRCKREEMDAWCPVCTRALGSAPANTPLAEVRAAAPALVPLAGVMPVSSTGPAADHAVRNRPSMLTPPGEEVLRGRRPSTGQHAPGRRPTPASRPGGTPAYPAGSRQTPASPARGTRVLRGGVRKPLPAGALGAPAARRPSSASSEIQPPPRDHTLLYIAIGVALLLIGLLLFAYAMNKKESGSGRKPSSEAPSGKTGRKDAK